MGTWKKAPIVRNYPDPHTGNLTGELEPILTSVYDQLDGLGRLETPSSGWDAVVPNDYATPITALNALIAAGKTEVWILVNPGTYTETTVPTSPIYVHLFGKGWDSTVWIPTAATQSASRWYLSGLQVRRGTFSGVEADRCRFNASYYDLTLSYLAASSCTFEATGDSRILSLTGNLLASACEITINGTNAKVNVSGNVVYEGTIWCMPTANSGLYLVSGGGLDERQTWLAEYRAGGRYTGSTSVGFVVVTAPLVNLVGLWPYVTLNRSDGRYRLLGTFTGITTTSVGELNFSGAVTGNATFSSGLGTISASADKFTFSGGGPWNALLSTRYGGGATNFLTVNNVADSYFQVAATPAGVGTAPYDFGSGSARNFVDYAGTSQWTNPGTDAGTGNVIRTSSSPLGGSFASPSAELNIGDTVAAGTAVTALRSDCQFAFPAPSAGYPLDVAEAEADGSATTPARSDHVHAHGTGYLPNAHHPQYESRVPLGSWVQDNVAISQTAVTLGLLGDATRTALSRVRAGSVTGVVVRSNEACTAGTATVEVTINGTGTGLTAQLNTTDTLFKVATQAAGLDTYAAGDQIGVIITTSADWAPTTADITVLAELVE